MIGAIRVATAVMFIVSNVRIPGSIKLRDDSLISKPAITFLKVYDMSGKEVKTLLNEYQSIGNYKTAFDASSLPAGVYFYRMKAGEFSDIRKLVLIK